MNEQIVILDFGSQYTQVIARRIRECKVYSTIVHYNTPAAVIAEMNASGIILSGGPSSVYAKDAPLPDKAIFKLGIPVLGICFGLQVMARFLKGKVERGQKREYGKGTLRVKNAQCRLFDALPRDLQVWNSHGDKLTKLPDGFKAVATTENSGFAAIENAKARFYGLQFHPEVVHTPRGKKIISNFVHKICGCGRKWTMRSYVKQAVEEIRVQVGKEKVILGLSGGVDSSVAAALIHKAIGKQLTCIFVNNGVLRANEAGVVRKVFDRNFKVKLHYEDSTNLFMRKLRGVTDPETKRKIIGNTFIDVFQKATRKVGKAKFLAQGTLYPDVIESIPIGGNPAALIKSHHNVGGLPDDLQFALVEPLRTLFKDEVRAVGRELGLPEDIVGRQPFPGPGLAIRIVGEITRDRLATLRQADSIVREELTAAGLDEQIWQCPVVLLADVRSVGVQGDGRTYGHPIVLRPVSSEDAMTADWTRLPYDVLETISTRVTNEVSEVNRVVLDVTSKPPGTIEWE